MMNTGEKDIVIDMESCTNVVVENGFNVGEGKTYLSKFWGGYVNCDGLNRGEEAVSSEKRLHNCAEGRLENGEPLVVEKRVGEDEKAVVAGAEKHKKKGCKKPPKPPRPPRPLSLNSADDKLTREISELAMLRRARIERMKALKKVKNGKTASSAGSTFALVVTLVFCFVIIWQGVFPRGSSITAFQGSPLSPMGSTPSSSSFISIKFYSNASTITGSS